LVRDEVRAVEVPRVPLRDRGIDPRDQRRVFVPDEVLVAGAIEQRRARGLR
jgi:hypothetical protein